MKLAVGGLIVTILLGLYVYSVGVAVLVVKCVSTKGCTNYPLASFTDGMAQALALIGGLVSALVVAELAITKPGEPPLARAITSSPSGMKPTTVKWLTWTYILVWIGAGLTAYVVGQMQHPNVLQPLTDFGQAWLGLAVAAGYAYFGINPDA